MATLAVAWALIQQRSRTTEIPLAAAEDAPDAALRLRMPQNWKHMAASDLPIGGVAGTIEVGTEGQPGRRIMVFRGVPHSLGTASTVGLTTAFQVADSLGASILMKGGDLGFGLVGPLPGRTLAMMTGPATGADEWQESYCLARAAVAPGGEVIGAVLQSFEPPGRADERLLDQVCRHIELTHLVFVDDPSVLMAAAGITFDIPDGVRFLAREDTAMPALRMMTEAGADSWHLDVYRLPLLGDRTPATLAEDFALSALQEATLSQPIKQMQIGQRPVAGGALSVLHKQAPSVYVLSVDVGNNTALLMIGRHEKEGGAKLVSACRSIAENAAVVPFDKFIDTAEAIARARECLERITAQGLESAFEPLIGQQLVYESRSPTLSLGKEVRTCDRQPENGMDFWKITQQGQYSLEGDDSHKFYGQWLIANDGVNYTRRLQVFKGGDLDTDYEEKRTGRRREVDRNLSVSENERLLRRNRRSTLPVDDTFTCHPVLILAGAMIARDRDTGPAIFTTSDTYPQDKVYCLLLPIGRRALPGNSSKSAWAVRMAWDYDPDPITLYYDDEGTLLVAEFGNGLRDELIQP